jgi:hypothetical protein
VKGIEYHSVYLDPIPALPVQRWAGHGSVAFVHDILAGPLPAEYASCDVLYADLPWRAGFGRYNQRAGVTDGRTFRQFMTAVAAVLDQHRGPAVLVTGKHALPYLPAPSQLVPLTMPVLDQPALAVLYNMAVSGEWVTTDDLLAYLAAAYIRVGDFCCGYGRTARTFAEAGRTFVASDHNPECVGYVAAHAASWGSATAS